MPPCREGPDSYQKGIAAKGDFKQASHTMQKKVSMKIILAIAIADHFCTIIGQDGRRLPNHLSPSFAKAMQPITMDVPWNNVEDKPSVKD